MPPFAIVLFVIGLPIVLATAIVQEGPPRKDRESGAGAGAASSPRADRVRRANLPGLETASDAPSCCGRAWRARRAGSERHGST